MNTRALLSFVIATVASSLAAGLDIHLLMRAAREGTGAGEAARSGRSILLDLPT